MARVSDRRILWAILLAGAVARLAPYLARPALSYDETMLSLNIVTRSFHGLALPLAYDQAAPVFYLWIVKLCALLGGVNEFALRLPTLAAGLVLPYVVWRSARRLLPPASAFFVAAVIALAPGLAQYAVIVKPYAIDALVTAILVDLALELGAHPDQPRSWYRLFAAGVVSVLLSTPAVFVLAGVGLFLVAGLDARHLRRTLAVGAGWVVVFAVAYFTLYQDAAEGRFLQTYWAADFLTPATWGLGGRAWGVLSHTFVEALVLRPVSDPLALVGSAGLLAGLWWLGRGRGRAAAILLVGPILVALLASLVRRYPFNWRLLLFTVPLVAVLLGAAVTAGLQTGGRWLRRATWAAAAVLLLGLAGVNISHPYRTAPVRQLIGLWGRERSRGEPIYVSPGAIPAWAFYATDWRHPDRAGLEALAASPNGTTTDLALGGPDSAVLIGRPSGTGWRVGVGVTQAHPNPGWAGGEAGRLAGAAGAGRTGWLLFTQTYGSEITDLRQALERSGARELEATGARGAMLLHETFLLEGDHR